jgi:hypothetical protein
VHRDFTVTTFCLYPKRRRKPNYLTRVPIYVMFQVLSTIQQAMVLSVALGAAMGPYICP